MIIQSNKSYYDFRFVESGKKLPLWQGARAFQETEQGEIDLFDIKVLIGFFSIFN